VQDTSIKEIASHLLLKRYVKKSQFVLFLAYPFYFILFFVHLFISDLLICSFIHLFIHSPIHSLTHSPIHPLTSSFTYSFIYLSIYQDFLFGFLYIFISVKLIYQFLSSLGLIVSMPIAAASLVETVQVKYIFIKVTTVPKHTDFACR